MKIFSCAPRNIYLSLNAGSGDDYILKAIYATSHRQSHSNSMNQMFFVCCFSRSRRSSISLSTILCCGHVTKIRLNANRDWGIFGSIELVTTKAVSNARAAATDTVLTVRKYLCDAIVVKTPSS